MSSAAAPVGPDTVGPYRLLQRLGEGGMGVVHLALDDAGRAVAIKLLRPHIADDAEARRRLAREVATLRRVRHPQVAAVIDADVEGDRPYVVTHFVPGKPLDVHVRQHGPLPRGHVARIGRVLAEALRSIHAAGIVHRDVKPANVMLLDGDPILIDFGIAHVADEARITRTGLVMGTPGYLSPEVIGGEAVTAATDWWGWGATLAYAATGRPPFGTGPIEVVLDRVRRGASDLSGIDAGLAGTLSAALATDAGRRPDPATLVAGLAAGPGRAAGAGRRSPEPVTVRLPPDPGTAPVPAPEPVTARVTPEPLPVTRRFDPPAGPPPVRWAPPTGLPPSAPGAPAGAAGAGPTPTLSPVPSAGPAPSDRGGAVTTAPRPGGPDPSGPAPSGLDAGPLGWWATLPPERGVVAGTVVALGLVAAVAPYGATWLAALLMFGARVVDRSRTGLIRRRDLRGPRGHDPVLTALGLPWHLLTAAAATVFALILPLAVGVCFAFIVAGAQAPSAAAARPGSPSSLFGGMVALLLTAWWGPGGASLRHGARTTATLVTRAPAGRVAVWVVIALASVTALSMIAHGVPPDWGAWAKYQLPQQLTR